MPTSSDAKLDQLLNLHPGDYNLKALDYIPKHDLHWVGNCNELNAGASDEDITLDK